MIEITISQQTIGVIMMVIGSFGLGCCLGCFLQAFYMVKKYNLAEVLK